MKPFASFNANQDAEVLFKAMKGLGECAAVYLGSGHAHLDSLGSVCTSSGF